MPKPPRIDPWDKVKFITNYFLTGCEPPQELVVDLSEEPKKDVLLLILSPDLFDISQAIVEPKKGRRRKPARHGRKRRRKIGIPDTSELIGQKARGFINPNNAFNFSATRLVFPLWNIWEGATFTAALLEGIVDIHYETLWGIMQVNNEECRDMPRLVRRKDEPQFAGGVGPIPLPIAAPITEFSLGFASTQWTCRCPTADFTVAVTMDVKNNSSADTVRMSAALSGSAGQGITQGSIHSIGPKGSATLRVAASFDQNTTCEWGLGTRTGFLSVESCDVLAYAKTDFPWE